MPRYASRGDRKTPPGALASISRRGRIRHKPLGRAAFTSSPLGAVEGKGDAHPCPTRTRRSGSSSSS